MVSAAAGIRLAGGGSVRLTLRISSKPSIVGIPKSAMTRRRRRSVANRGLGAPIRPSSLPLPRSRERPAAGPARLPRRQRQGRARLSADPADRLPRGRVSATGLPVPRRAPCREQSSAGALSRSRRCPPRRSTRRRFRHAARRARGQSPIRAPARRARLKSGCLPESLEDVGQKRRIDALPIIAHDDVGRGVPELQAQLHVPAARVNFTALESRYLGVSEDRVQRRTQLVRARRQQFVLQSVRLMGAAVRKRIVDRERGPCRQILGEGAFPLQAPTFEDGIGFATPVCRTSTRPRATPGAHIRAGQRNRGPIK